MQVDLEASHAIARSLPDDVIAISESGLKTADDLRSMTALGYKAFLIGERFMTDPDPARPVVAARPVAGRFAYPPALAVLTARFPDTAMR